MQQREHPEAPNLSQEGNLLSTVLYSIVVKLIAKQLDLYAMTGHM